MISRCMMRSRGSVPIAESISAKRAKSIATRFRAIFRWTGAFSSRHGSHDPSAHTFAAGSPFDLIPQFYDNRIDTIPHFYYYRNVKAGDERNFCSALTDAIRRQSSIFELREKASMTMGQGGFARRYRLGRKGKREYDAATLQRFVPVYRELSPFHHGRSHHESERFSELHWLQRREPPHGPCQSSSTQTDCQRGHAG